MTPSLQLEIAQAWTGRLAYFRSHRNDEHIGALFEEATRYFGLRLENDLCCSEYWSPSTARLSLVRFRRVFEPLAHAESWAASQPLLRPHLSQVIELVAALRHELARRVHSKNR